MLWHNLKSILNNELKETNHSYDWKEENFSWSTDRTQSRNDIPIVFRSVHESGRFDMLVSPFYITRRLPWIPRNAERYHVNRLFSVWLGPGVECRLVRRNTIQWTFLAYIAAHNTIESKRTTSPRVSTTNNGSRRDHRFVRCIVPTCFPLFLRIPESSPAVARDHRTIQGQFRP